jgi:hypothetical protein
LLSTITPAFGARCTGLPSAAIDRTECRTPPDREPREIDATDSGEAGRFEMAHGQRYQAFEVQPLSRVGAEIVGVDLAKPVDDETFEELRQASRGTDAHFHPRCP